MYSNRANKNGSIAAYVVMGVVLAVVLLGTMFLVKKRGEQARQSSEPVAVVEEKPIAVVVGTASAPQDNTEESTSVNENQQPAGELPETGPRNVFVGAFGIFLIVFSVTGFVKSAKLQKPLLYL